MAIQKISIEDFTVFKNIEIDFCSGINVFIGENGTGKTHLLKMLYAFCETEQGYEESEKTYVINKCFTTELMKCFQGHVILGENSGLVFEMNDLKFSYNKIKIINGEPCFDLENKFKKAIPSVFIPAKDMLTHSKGLIAMSKFYANSMPFDKTITDIIEKASRWNLDSPTPIIKNILPTIEKIMEGTVVQRDDEFFIVKKNGEEIRFSYEAEGIKKIGLIWKLLVNGSINKDTILFWDEPEANINPKIIPILVDILLEMSRQGVQIFIATHEYNVIKYISMKKESNEDVSFFSLYKTASGVACEKEDDYDLLENNVIIDAEIMLHKDEVKRVLDYAD